MHPSVQFLVHRADESRARGLGSSYIPTFGHVASTFDAYRTFAIHSIENAPPSWCLTDSDTEAALGRVIDGPIRSASDLDRAESALRAILLHEYIEILIPAYKAEFDPHIISYVRLDKAERNDAAFAAFNTAPCRDLLFATEYLTLSAGVVTASSNPSSLLIGKHVDQLPSLYRSALQTAGLAANALPIDLRAATHFTSPELLANVASGAAGFIDDIYRRVQRPWMEIANAGPALTYELALPPFLAMVLSRAPNRSKIPETLREIRSELASARHELISMNEMIERSLPQRDILAYAKKIAESFNAIVPESLLTDSERRKRALWSIVRRFKPVLNLYSIAIDPLSIERSKLLEAIENAKQVVTVEPRIVSRSVAATTLSELLRVESIRDTVLTHFSTAEVELLQGEMRR